MAQPLPERQPPASMVMTVVNGRQYPMRSVYNCRTCQSPHRQFIEDELIRGRSYTAIARQVADLPEGPMPHPSNQGVAAHVQNGHMPVPHEQRRGIIEKRARDIGKSIDTDENLVDYVAANHLVVQRGVERLASGEIDVDTRDLLSAISILHKIETTSPEGYDVEAYQEAMFVYMEVAQKFMPREVFDAYGKALRRNPILRAIAAKLESGRSEAVEGEATDVRDE